MNLVWRVRDKRTGHFRGGYYTTSGTAKGVATQWNKRYGAVHKYYEAVEFELVERCIL